MNKDIDVTEHMTNREAKNFKRAQKEKKLSELRNYYVKHTNKSRAGKVYQSYKKRNKSFFNPGVITFRQVGNKTILWPVAV